MSSTSSRRPQAGRSQARSTPARRRPAPQARSSPLGSRRRPARPRHHLLRESHFSASGPIGCPANVEIGGLFNLQKTDLEASGLINRGVPQSIYNYHGYLAYNFGDPDATVRPYFLGGVGATQYGSLKTAAGDVGGNTQFSTT